MSLLFSLILGCGFFLGTVYSVSASVLLMRFLCMLLFALLFFSAVFLVVWLCFFPDVCFLVSLFWFASG